MSKFRIDWKQFTVAAVSATDPEGFDTYDTEAEAWQFLLDYLRDNLKLNQARLEQVETELRMLTTDNRYFTTGLATAERNHAQGQEGKHP